MRACYLALLAASHILGAWAQCYNPDGSETSTTFQPCSPSDQKTHCCDSGSTCLSTGLCLVKWDSSFSTGGCTDPTWNSDNCFPHCKSEHLGTVSTVFRCSGNRWCCADGANATGCCHDPKVKLFEITKEAYVENGTAFVSGYNIAPIQNIISTGTISSPTASGTTTTTTTTTAAAHCSGNATTTGVGVGLGIGLPLLFAVGVLSFLLMRERKRNRSTGPMTGGLLSAASSSPRTDRPLSPTTNKTAHTASPSSLSSPPIGSKELPNTPSSVGVAGAGQPIHLSELHSKDQPYLAELPGHNKA